MSPRVSAVHVLLEILIHILEHEHELILRVNDIMKGNYVFVLKLFHEGDLSNGSTRSAFFTIKMNLFKRDEFASLAIASLEDLAGKYQFCEDKRE